MVIDRTNITIVIIYEVRYMPWNETTENVVHHDLDLQFQGHEFLNGKISKTVTASKKCSRMTYIEVDIFHRM